MSRVTFVVTSHDRPHTLPVALHSILATIAEARVRADVLVIDDASTDRLAIREIAHRLDVSFIGLPSRVGFVQARAYALDATTSEFVTFLDDDDAVLPCWLRRHLALADRGADVVSSSYWLADRDLTPVRPWILEPVTMADLLAGRISANDGSLIRRSVLEGVALRPELETTAMMALWLELASRGARFATIPTPTWLYRRHDGNQSSRLDAADAANRAALIADYAVPA